MRFDRKQKIIKFLVFMWYYKEREVEKLFDKIKEI